jgi:hypothetical protein
MTNSRTGKYLPAADGMIPDATSIADVVERALEAYEIREAGREPASAFYARLANDYGSDLDLEAVIREHRKINPGPEL